MLAVSPSHKGGFRYLVICRSVESDSDVLGPPLVRNVCTFTSHQHLIMPNVILWSPCEQFPLVTFQCPKCSDQNMQASLSPMDWTCGQASPHRLPRLIYCLNMNILLVSRVYGCCNEHHPGMLNQLSKCGLESSIPFVLWHQNGFSLQVMEHNQQLISSGMSLQECESSLAENRL